MNDNTRLAIMQNEIRIMQKNIYVIATRLNQITENSEPENKEENPKEDKKNG